jgi:hypothetical protein
VEDTILEADALRDVVEVLADGVPSPIESRVLERLWLARCGVLYRLRKIESFGSNPSSPS